MSAITSSDQLFVLNDFRYLHCSSRLWNPNLPHAR